MGLCHEQISLHAGRYSVGKCAQRRSVDELCLSRKLAAFSGAEECAWDDCFGIRCSLFVGSAATGEACEEDWHCESALKCHGDSCRIRCRF